MKSNQSEQGPPTRGAVTANHSRQSIFCNGKCEMLRSCAQIMSAHAHNIRGVYMKL